MADVGNEVWCVDKDVEKLSLMNEGNTPFYEPQLDEIIARNLRKGTLFFTEDLEGAMRGATICIIAVGTPSDERGAAEDRKSTRLNSSHYAISYAVFCLKKKKTG